MADSSKIRGLRKLLCDRRLQRIGKMHIQGSLNVFRVLKLQNHEIRHSNFLEFLFDPAREHGCNDIFYRSFCEAAGIKEAAKPPNVVVDREREHLDLLVHDRNNGTVIVIENKRDARERLGQTAEYRKKAEDMFATSVGRADIHLIYLTPDGHDAEDPQWKSISYAIIAKCVRNLLKREGLHDKVRIVMKDYLNIIEV